MTAKLEKLLADPRVKAAVHSFGFTALGVVCGLYLDAISNGQGGSLVALLLYFKLHWWVWVSAQILTPAARAYQAQKVMNNGTNA